MANLIATFTRAHPSSNPANRYPIEVGSAARTEAILIDASSTQGSELGTEADYIVSLYAEAACWVAIGSNPTAAANTGRKMAADERLQLWVGVGEKVAVIQV